MSTTLDDIRRWLDNRTSCNQYMLVICDMFDHEDFPVYCATGRQAWERILKAQRGENMEKFMECYDLSKPIEEQIKFGRIRNFPPEIEKP